jgi:hypothetical protein
VFLGVGGNVGIRGGDFTGRRALGLERYRGKGERAGDQ